jgi:hypothetical protein
MFQLCTQDINYACVSSVSYQSPHPESLLRHTLPFVPITVSDISFVGPVYFHVKKKKIRNDISDLLENKFRFSLPEHLILFHSI